MGCVGAPPTATTSAIKGASRRRVISSICPKMAIDERAARSAFAEKKMRDKTVRPLPLLVGHTTKLPNT